MKLIIIIFAGLFFGCNQNESNTSEENSAGIEKDFPISQDYFISSDYSVPGSIDELEERLEFIVTVEAKEINEFGEQDDELAYTSTLTNVEITNVHKGNLKENHEIVIAEQYFLFEGELVFVGGYTPMRMGEEYILFLRDQTEDVYTVTSIGYGKYNVEEEALVERGTQLQTYEDLSNYRFLADHDEEKEQYDRIKNEVISEYGE